MTGYQVLVANTRTGAVIDGLDQTGWSFDEPLEWADAGKLDVTVPLPGVDRAGQLVRSSLRSIASSMSGVTLAVVRNDENDGNSVLFAGPVVTLGWSSGDVAIGCAGPSWIYDRRILIRNPYWGNPLHPLADLSFALEPRDLAIELLRHGRTGTRRDLPISLPDVSGRVGDVVTYRALDLRTAYEAIKEVSEAEGGPDVVLQPRISADQSTLSWDAAVGAPSVGAMNPDAVWDFPLVAITGDLDDSESVSTAYVVGDAPDGYDGSEEQIRLIGVSVTDRGDPWPALERADRTSVSEARPEQLAALAASYGAGYAYAVEEITLSCPVDSGPAYRSAWNLGDSGRFTVSGHPWLDDLTSTRRIVAVGMDADELRLTTVGGRLTVGGATT